MRSQIRLPVVLAVGFKGDEALRDEAACAKSIHQFLAQQAADQKRMLCGVCGLACVADLIFAEGCLDLKIPLRLLLPHDPRQAHYSAPSERTRADTVIASSASTESFGYSAVPVEASYERGIEIIQRSQILLAVTDAAESSESTKIDATASMIAFAQALRRPVLRLDTAGKSPDDLAPEGIKPDPELDFLARLPDEGVTLQSDSSTALAEAWFEKIERNATRLAPQVMRLAHLPILLTAIAALVSGAATRGVGSGIWLTAGAVLGAVAASLPIVLRLGRRQTLWARSRFAAEVCRSVLTLWGTPAGFHAVSPQMIPELAGMLRSLDLLKILSGTPNGIPVDQFKEQYLAQRVSHQIRYFATHTKKSARDVRLFGTISMVAVPCAITIYALSFLLGRGSHHIAASHTAWIALCVSALFQLSTVAGAMRIVKDCDRRQRRYREIGDLLTISAVELQALKTWPPVLQTVARIEDVLLVELIEWRSLIQNIKMPRS